MNASRHPLDHLVEAITLISSTDEPERQKLVNAVCFGVYLAESDPALARYVAENLRVGLDDDSTVITHTFDQLAATFRAMVERERPGDLNQ